MFYQSKSWRFLNRNSFLSLICCQFIILRLHSELNICFLYFMSLMPWSRHLGAPKVNLMGLREVLMMKGSTIVKLNL